MPNRTIARTMILHKVFASFLAESDARERPTKTEDTQDSTQTHTHHDDKNLDRNQRRTIKNGGGGNRREAYNYIRTLS